MADTKSDIQLFFYPLASRLVGAIGNKSFNMKAESGSGRGSIGNKAASFSDASWSPATRADEASGTRGGPIPFGLWMIEKPSTYQPADKAKDIFARPVARLYPAGGQPIYGRSGFLIHGRGALGSDGCIVLDKEERKTLLNAVETSSDPVYILVTMTARTGGGDRKANVS